MQINFSCKLGVKHWKNKDKMKNKFYVILILDSIVTAYTHNRWETRKESIKIIIHMVCEVNERMNNSLICFQFWDVYQGKELTSRWWIIVFHSISFLFLIPLVGVEMAKIPVKLNTHRVWGIIRSCVGRGIPCRGGYGAGTSDKGPAHFILFLKIQYFKPLLDSYSF